MIPGKVRCRYTHKKEVELIWKVMEENITFAHAFWRQLSGFTVTAAVWVDLMRPAKVLRGEGRQLLHSCARMCEGRSGFDKLGSYQVLDLIVRTT